MGICVPKHIVCDWYAPVFTPGPTGCTLPIYSESKARLLIGGSFFRSKDIGAQTNEIWISSTWQVHAGGSPNDWRDYNAGGGDTIADVVGVDIIITNNVITEPYRADQIGAGSPPWTLSGIPSLRSQLSTSQLVEMPEIDVQTVLTSPEDTWDSTADDDDHLAEFSSTYLSGGTSGPTTKAELDAIRTGPALTMVYIDTSEKGNADGSITELGETRYWNGYCYKGYTPDAPDCHDPADHTGSPAGSPPFCGSGPESDC